MFVPFSSNRNFISSCFQDHECLKEVVHNEPNMSSTQRMFGKILDPHRDLIDVKAGDSNMKAEKTLI